MVLSACSTAPPKPSADAQPGAFWQGRLSVRVDSEPAQSVAAGFELRGSAEVGELLLTSPLGNTLARLDWSPTHAAWHQGEQVIDRDSVEALSQDLLGTPLPITALFDWLHGRTSTQAHDWQADLSRHAEGRIIAHRTQPPPRAELRLIFQP
jgi:outer membrane lipoprotein LolB